MLSDLSDPSNCSWVDIAQPSGIVDHRYSFSGCADRGSFSSGLPQTEYDSDDLSFLFMTGSGHYIYHMEQMYQTSEVWAQLPDKYDFTIGMQLISNQGLYLLTTSTLYLFPTTAPTSGVRTAITLSTSLSLSTSAQLSGDYWVTKLYVVDGSLIYTVDLSDLVYDPTSQRVTGQPVWSSVKMPLTGKTDVSVCWEGGSVPDSVLLIQSFKLYNVDPSTGDAVYVMDIPNQGEAPRFLDVLSPTLLWADSTTIWSGDIDLNYNNGTVLTRFPFEGKAMVGNFQIYPGTC